MPDFAHVMISLCRAASIPARYVGGVRILHVERRGVQG
jgi:transglutaminase-like putative cysteine protease